MNDIEKIAWTAGLLEGEGSFLTKTNANRPIVTCHMTDEDVILKLQEYWGGQVYFSSARKENYKDSWRWQLGGDPAAELMEKLKPFMFVRRNKKIDEVLKIWYDKKEQNNLQYKNGEKAAKEYLEGNLSLRQVAKKYSTTYETVRRYVIKNKELNG